MRGDGSDFVARLRLTLPESWFADDAPLLTGLCQGLAAAWSSLYDLLTTVRRQGRLATATGQFLDLASRDFFGNRIARRGGESDDALRSRLQHGMQREGGTRTALVLAATEAGYSANVFEPARPADTGAYNTSGGLAWGTAGGWGSLQMPLECLVTVTPVSPVEPIGSAVAAILPAGGAAWVRVSE